MLIRPLRTRRAASNEAQAEYKTFPPSRRTVVDIFFACASQLIVEQLYRMSGVFGPSVTLFRTSANKVVRCVRRQSAERKYTDAVIRRGTVEGFGRLNLLRVVSRICYAKYIRHRTYQLQYNGVTYANYLP